MLAVRNIVTNVTTTTRVQRLGMVAGGTGITPMLQLITAILKVCAGLS